MIFPRHVILSKGSHDDPLDGHCAMEAVAFLAGEPHSDHPECASRAIANFIRSWNDNIPDDETRTRLILPLVPRIVGTRGTEEQEMRRSYLALDWLIREWTPAWLELAGLDSDAAALRQCAELRDLVTVTAARPAVEQARRSAAAAGAAAWVAAGVAARSVAGVAAWSVAGSVAGAAAWSAARSVAGSVAGVAAWSAAWSAAGERLAPTVASLQQSALGLVDRMIEVKPGDFEPGDFEPGDFEIDEPARRVTAEAVTA